MDACAGLKLPLQGLPGEGEQEIVVPLPHAVEVGGLVKHIVKNKIENRYIHAPWGATLNETAITCLAVAQTMARAAMLRLNFIVVSVFEWVFRMILTKKYGPFYTSLCRASSSDIRSNIVSRLHDALFRTAPSLPSILAVGRPWAPDLLVPGM